MSFALITWAQLMENRTSGQEKLHTLPAEGHEDVLMTLITLLRRFNPDFWQVDKLLPFKICGMSLPFDMFGDDFFSYLAFFSFRQAVSRIERQSPADPSLLDRIVDCVLSSPFFHPGLSVSNQLWIALSAFQSGASLHRSIVINFAMADPDHGILGEVPCVQEAWPCFIWRLVFMSSLYMSEAAKEEACVKYFLPLLKFCLRKGANPDAHCLIPVGNIVKRIFIHEMSILSYVESVYAVHYGSHKEDVLRELKDYNARPYSRVKYYADANLTLYRLTEAQSDDLDEILADCCAPYDFWYDLRSLVSYDEKSATEGAYSYIRDKLDEAVELGSLKPGVVVGDESTYQIR